MNLMTNDEIHTALSNCRTFDQLADVVQYLREQGIEFTIESVDWGTPESDDIISVGKTFVCTEILKFDD